MYELGHFIDGKRVAGKSGRVSNIFNPATGEVQGTVALASDAELSAAVESAKAAQPKWAATNPQRRARVFMKFVELLNANMNELAEILSREHGKTIEDAKGDLIRGLEVCEFVIGIPHLQKSEFTEGAGPGIDMYSIRQAVGIGADGSRSEGFKMKVFPQAMASGYIHIGTMAGKLNGVMPATTPSGWRIE